jgi:hypothetical protein
METNKFLPPLRAVMSPHQQRCEQYSYGYTYLAKQKAQGQKAQIFVGS